MIIKVWIISVSVWISEHFDAWIERRELRRIRKFTCNSCENLKLELSRLHDMNKELLNKLTEKPVIESIKEPIPITRPMNTYVPMSVKRQMAERESRKIANDLLRKKGEEISELENQVVNGKLNE